MKLTTLVLVLFSMFHTSISSAAASNPAATRKYSDVLTVLNTLVTTYPQNVQLITVGDSDSGQKIMGVAIGHGATHNLVVSTHHGNEYGSTEVAIAFAQAIAANPIANQTVYVIPVLNIGGYNSKIRTEKSSGARSQTYDPNRNYPSPCGTEGPFTLKDTAALDKFVAANNIVASATLHTFSPAVTYPWGLSTHDLTTGYETIFKGLVTEATRDSHYATGNTTDLIYPANGSFEDYAFLQYGIWSILFEIGDTHTPSATQVAQLVQVNVPGLRRMLESAPTERAANHAFAGTCDMSREMRKRDRHDE